MTTKEKEVEKADELTTQYFALSAHNRLVVMAGIIGRNRTRLILTLWTDATHPNRFFRDLEEGMEGVTTK